MNKQDFKNRFNDYVSRRVSDNKKENLFKGEFSGAPASSLNLSQQSAVSSALKSSNDHTQSFPNSETYYLYTPTVSNRSSSSFNSSEFDYSKYQSSKKKSKENNGTPRKRLKKLRELQENECPICLDQITNRCQLPCHHHFCRDCLLGWLSNTNKCPYCRAEVHSYWFKGEQYEIQQKQFEYEGDVEENLDWVCYNCDHTDDGDIVLICDRCEANACHISCDPSLHGAEPVGDWYCHFCR